MVSPGRRISAIAAMASTGMVGVELVTSSVNGDYFDFVRGSVIQEMLPFDGRNPLSIAVLDNCSIHHVQELFQEAGILVLFLPPYSPDLMPIEKTFSYVKYYLKEHDELWQAMGDPTAITKAAFDSGTVLDTLSDYKFISNTDACMVNDTTLAFVHVCVRLAIYSCEKRYLITVF